MQQKPLPKTGCVLKIGGSLFQKPNLRKTLDLLLSATAGQMLTKECQIDIVAGGGQMVDIIREWDQTQNLGQETSHRLAVHAMDITADFLGKVLEVATFTPKLDKKTLSISKGQDFGDQTCKNQGSGQSQKGEIASRVVKLGRILTENAAQVKEIPQNWEVSSDSIALWYAQNTGFGKLFLAKSLDPLEEKIGLDKMTSLGWVDPYFATLKRTYAPSIEVLVVHATNPKLPITRVES